MRGKVRTRRGVALVLVAICIVVIMVFAALALDLGMLLDGKCRAQAAADAAALSAAQTLLDNWGTYQGVDTSGEALASALATASANGWTSGPNATVTVTFSPNNYQAGPNAGGAIPPGYAEVIIELRVKRAFSAVLGSGDLPVRSRAVARGIRQETGVGLLLMNPTAQGALALSGSASIRVQGSILVNSNNVKAAVSTGSASVRTTSAMNITGNYASVGSSYFSANPLTTGATPSPNILADLQLPLPQMIDNYGNAGSMTTRSNTTYRPVAGETLQPGLYIGGINISSRSNVTFAPGIYYLRGGGLTMSGGTSSATALGVMIYNGAGTSGVGKITMSGGGRWVQSPPTSGRYTGIAMFQDPTSTQPIGLSGSSTWNLTGTIYAPLAPVSLTGASGGTMGSQFVVDKLTLSGSGTFNDIDPSKGYTRADLRLVQ